MYNHTCMLYRVLKSDWELTDDLGFKAIYYVGMLNVANIGTSLFLHPVNYVYVYCMF